MTEQPRFMHHCDRCLFLGRFHLSAEDYAPRKLLKADGTPAEDFDLYVCGEKGLLTVLARYDDDREGDYFAADYGYTRNPILLEAERRVMERG